MKALWWLAAIPLMVSCGDVQTGNAKPAAKKTTATTTAKKNGAASRPVSLNRLPPDAIALKKVAIQDPGVIAPMTALNALIPASWTTRGGVVMPANGLCAEPFAVDWAATSPDGRSSVAVFPTEVWAYSNTSTSPNCTPAHFTSVRDYLSARAQRTFPGARIIDYRPRPDFAKAAVEQAQRTQAMASGMGLSMRAWAEGGEVLFAYNANGVEMRGVMGATATFYGSQLPNPMGGQPLISLTGQTLGTFAATAPDGRLDFKLVEAVRRSISPDPRWLQRLFSLQNQLNGVAAQGTRERAAMIVAGGAAATRSNIAAFETMARSGPQSGSGTTPRSSYDSDAADDRMQRERIEGIRGVETYHDPVGEQNVQLDATYDHAWRVNNQDTYILTNDPNFNPGQYDIQATQLKALP